MKYRVIENPGSNVPSLVLGLPLIQSSKIQFAGNWLL